MTNEIGFEFALQSLIFAILKTCFQHENTE